MMHLNDEQFAEWLGGESSSEVREHLAQCDECRRESEALGMGVARYAHTLRYQAARAEERTQVLQARWLPRPRLSLAISATLLVILAGEGLWLARPHPAPAVAVAPVTAPTSPVQMNDDELLEAVNKDLTRDVPEALAPVSAITSARNKMAAAAASASN